MAEHMKNYLGAMLYTDPVGEDRKVLPSPDELKHTIMVKAKKLPPGMPTLAKNHRWIVGRL